MAGAPRSTRRVATEAAGANDDVDAKDDDGALDEAPPRSGSNRRSAERFDVTWSVDCETEDTFLYASIANISEMGIFVQTEAPLAVGTELWLRFAPTRRPLARAALVGRDALVVRGRVQWVNPVRPGGDNPNPGMGVRFIDLDLATRELLVEVVRSIAYLRDDVAGA
jgi:type IV pilus assembly protein PilZ